MAATEQFPFEQDHLAKFEKERLQFGPGFDVATGDLFRDYLGWHHDNEGTGGGVSLTREALRRRLLADHPLTERLVGPHTPGGRQRGLRGVRLNPRRPVRAEKCEHGWSIKLNGFLYARAPGEILWCVPGVPRA